MIASPTNELENTKTQLAIRESLGIKPADDDGEASLPPSGLDGRSPAVTEARQRARQKKYNIPSDKVFPATETLPENQRSAIRWLHAYAIENDFSVHDLGAKLRRNNAQPYSGNTIFKILTGQHEADLENVSKSIEALRRIVEERGAMHRAKFIETRLTRRMYKIFDAARIYRKIMFCYSDGQVGKTTTAEEYQRTHNHGETILVRMPAGATLRGFLEELALALNLDVSGSTGTLRRRLVRCFSENMLLIVDEAHQLFLRRFMVETLELIREIYDRCRCGVVLIGTKIIAEELQKGKHKALLAQLDRRSLAKIELPSTPARPELDAFAAEYGLAPADGEAMQLQHATIRDCGLGVWCAYLQAGSHVASKRRKPMAWQHVLDAHAGLKALEQMKDLD